MTGARVSNRLATFATICVAVTIAGLVLAARQMAAVLLTAYVATLSVVLGTMAMTMIAQLTTATWFASFEQPAKRILASLPVLALLGVVPVAVAIWNYTSSPSPPGSARAQYLAPWFVVSRAVVYWAIWLVMGQRLLSSKRSSRFASGGLVVLAITMTFASFDWMMSLSVGWYSTVYGVYWFAGGMIGALALLAILARSRSDDYPVARNRWLALGSLLLTFVLFWAYIGFAQYIVIWSGDIPREVTWYVERAHGAWGGVALAILISGGAIPFLILLLGRTRRSGGALTVLCALLLAFHYVDSYWLVMPNLARVDAWTIVLSGFSLGAVIAASMLLARMRTAGVRQALSAMPTRARPPRT